MTKHVIYILSGEMRGPVFIGASRDLERCLRRHRSGKVSRPEFRLDRLIYTERFDCAFKADQRRQALKTASREWLDRLILSQNPTWQDLLAAPIKIPQAA